MSIYYLPGYHPTTSANPPTDSARTITGRDVPSNALSNALAVTQRSPGWNNRKPDIQRVQLGACTLLAVPYRRWAWRRYEQRVAAQRRKEA